MAASFSQAVAPPDERLNLAEAALLIADHAYPDLNPAPYLRRLDELAAALSPSLRGIQSVGSASQRRAALFRLNDHLFGTEGFTGNQQDYYDPRNSYLNQVLDRRTGIPITLSIVYLEVGWRLGLPLAGVGLPAHFMVRWVGTGEPLLIDPFEGGLLLTVDSCQGRLSALLGRRVTLSEEWLKPVSRRDILARVLLNLRAAAAGVQRFDEAAAAAEKLVILRPGSPEELRDLGVLHARAGHRWAAIRRLEEYLSVRPEAPDADEVKRLTNDLFRAATGAPGG